MGAVKKRALFEYRISNKEFRILKDWQGRINISALFFMEILDNDDYFYDNIRNKRE